MFQRPRSTPIRSIDFIQTAYKEAGLTPEDVDTGAVIITGEALKKENAQPIVEDFREVFRQVHLRCRGSQS